jgi:rhamnopyranosyl-N-acetylglucosaminyl-diphospho-decaprenol beta-1,3/1,4-galactofuranosyltransferase
VDYLRSIEGKNNIECVYLSNNIGYAGGIAHGMQKGLAIGNYDFFWIMDDDSLPKNTTLEDLIDTIASSPFDILGLEGSNYRYGVKKKIPLSSEKVQPVDFVLIDGALVKAEAVKKIGFPDEKFFMMCEDYEYCKRLRKHGFKVGLLNRDLTNRLHLGGGGRFTKATLWRGYYHSRNHFLIIKQYFSFSHLLGYLFSQTKFIIAAAIYAPDRVQRVKFRLLGMWHGLRGVKGKTLDPGTLQFSKK